MHALVYVKWLMHRIQNVIRIGSANPKNGMWSALYFDARIQVGIENTMQLVWCTEPGACLDKCMNARMHCIRYAKIDVP